MRIDDEPTISFSNEHGIGATYTIKELVGLRETCSDDEYSERISTCRSCRNFVGNEICNKNEQLVRVFCRLLDSKCPKNFW